MADLPADLDAMVSTIWQGEQARLGGVLFNGRVFSADVITPDLVTGHWTEYRRIVAQVQRPELHERLAIRPLAVGGIILGPDGVLFGRRPERAVYQQGEWQLPPAGNVDQTCAREGGVVDVVAMLHTELGEELGLAAEQVSDPRPVAIVEHAGSHVCDLGIAVRTKLRAEALLAAHRAGGNGEYEPLVVVALTELAAFVARDKVNLQAPMFLRTLGLLSAPSLSR